MKIISAVAVVSLTIATPAFAQVMPAADYVKAAGASDLFERKSAQIVLKTTKDPKIRHFASMMLTAHAKSTADVKAAAMRAKVRVAPPMLMPAQVEMISQLRKQTGMERDTTYITQQKAAHDQALALQQGYAMNGKAMPLKRAASKIVPVVKMHIATLNAM